MLAGKWDMVLHSPMGAKIVVFEAVEDGEALTGKFSAESGWNTEIYEGSVSGDDFRFKVDFPVPAMGSFTFTLTGKVEGDSMSGIAKMAVGKCKFEAKRI
ncbi:MAG: hypothetical protein LBI64_02105 [Coriobacteriales bacterium]|jgi:hypothetical protein|nr:hypothetical protein [Coriobacteriales bacterium]